jgi:hypothetical protein
VNLIGVIHIHTAFQQRFRGSSPGSRANLKCSSTTSIRLKRLYPGHGIGTVVMTNATGFDVRKLLDTVDAWFLREQSG